MKLGLVGYQGSGKSALFELLTGLKPDPAKAHLGQLGTAVVHDARFDGLVGLYKPKKVSPARIELFDTPGLDRKDHDVERCSPRGDSRVGRTGAGCRLVWRRRPAR